MKFYQCRASSSVIMLCCVVDERALVEGARQLGFVFSVRTPQAVTISAVCLRRKVSSYCNIMRAFLFLFMVDCVYDNPNGMKLTLNLPFR